MPDSFKAAVGPPPRTPFACLADNDLARRVLTFFEDFLVLLVAMVCSPSDSAESSSCRLKFRLIRLFFIPCLQRFVGCLSPTFPALRELVNVTGALSLGPLAVIRRVEPAASLS